MFMIWLATKLQLHFCMRFPNHVRAIQRPSKLWWVVQFAGSKSCRNIVNGCFCVGHPVWWLLKLLLGWDLVSQHPHPFTRLTWFSCWYLYWFLTITYKNPHYSCFINLLFYPDVPVRICWLMIEMGWSTLCCKQTRPKFQCSSNCYFTTLS